MPKTSNRTVIVNGIPLTIDDKIILYKYAEIYSLESLIELGFDCPNDDDPVEETAIYSALKPQLYQALNILTKEERVLIMDLYFSNDGLGVTDSHYARINGLPRTTVTTRRNVIEKKLKIFFENPPST